MMHFQGNPGAPGDRRRNKGGLPPLVESGLFMLCGLIIGAGLTVFLMDTSVHQFWTRPDQLPDRLIHRMQSVLDLSTVQRDEATRIIDRHFKTFDTLRREVQPEVQRTLDALRDDISGILDPAQRDRWEENFERIRQKWQPGPLVPSGDEQAATD